MYIVCLSGGTATPQEEHDPDVTDGMTVSHEVGAQVWRIVG